jgi:hypothetical protein
MKGLTLQEFSAMALSFVIVAVIISVSGTILTQMKVTEYNTTAVTNESHNFAANYTAYASDNSPILSISDMYDDASHTNTYASTFYGFNSTGVYVLTNGTGGYPNMTTGTHYFDYTYTNQYTLTANLTSQGLSGITTMSQWLPTIAVIVAAAVVIGVIVNYFRQ